MENSMIFIKKIQSTLGFAVDSFGLQKLDPWECMLLSSDISVGKLEK
jgi:hypothetical protein